MITNDPYTLVGVDYEPLDRFKRHCQVAARATVSCLQQHCLNELDNIRGESAYVLEAPHEYLAHVEEGLGTKNIVADAMVASLGGRAYYGIGIDMVAAIVNDMITVGALPFSVAMHAAVGNTGWFDRNDRGEHLAAGFAQGCELAGAVWGGGESPMLKGVVESDAAVLAGSAVGRISPKAHRITGMVRNGDAIIFLGSSGIHANGITLCRAIAGKLPDGFQTHMNDGNTFGLSLLEPTVIYVPFIRECLRSGIIPHYAVHVTGHGWRKLMRLAEPFVYRITNPPTLSTLYTFLLDVSGMSQAEAYSTFNMGVGFAIYVDPTQADQCLDVARRVGLKAWVGGIIEKQGDRKAVELEPLGITFEGNTLNVRA